MAQCLPIHASQNDCKHCAIYGHIAKPQTLGDIAHSKRFVDILKSWIGFLCKKFYVYPGEGEMEALALGVLRVLKKEEEPKIYE